METKLNIAEILKDKPKGTKLYSPLFGNVYFSDINNSTTYVLPHTSMASFYSDATFIKFEEAEPLLFPSKEMRDWSKFAWKRGDVLVSNDKNTHIVFEKFTDDTYTTFTGKHYRSKISKNGYEYVRECSCATEEYTLEAENAAQTYIKTIEEKLGGKLNRDTLEIEKQPEFKDGDIVVYKCEIEDIPDVIFIFRGKNQHAPFYSYYASLDSDGFLSYKLGAFGIYNRELRLATEEEKQQLFDALAKRGKAWDAEKKLIVDLKPKVELKPFDKVLVRDHKSDNWRANLFSHIDKNGCHYCVWDSWHYCIPYEGNEHLLGTTKDVEG